MSRIEKRESIFYKCSIPYSILLQRKARAVVDEKTNQSRLTDKLAQEKLQQQQLQQKKDEREKKRKKIASTLSFENDFEDNCDKKLELSYLTLCPSLLRCAFVM